jgi:hypothetical protein
MANERYLDLDAFAAESGKIKFKGETYEIPDVSVELYSRAIKLQEQIENATNEEEMFGAIIGLLGTMVPSMPEKTIRALSIKQLISLLNFVVEDLRGELGKNAIAPIQAPKTKTKKSR